VNLYEGRGEFATKPCKRVRSLRCDKTARLAGAPIWENRDGPSEGHHACEIVNEVGRQVNEWWTSNRSEGIDWGFRLPTFAAGVAMLGWAGANMPVGTSAVAASLAAAKQLEPLGIDESRHPSGDVGRLLNRLRPAVRPPPPFRTCERRLPTRRLGPVRRAVPECPEGGVTCRSLGRRTQQTLKGNPNSFVNF